MQGVRDGLSIKTDRKSGASLRRMAGDHDLVVPAGVMGAVFVDSPNRPASAAALLGDFCFLAGEPNRELVQYGPKERDFLIMVPGKERLGRADRALSRVSGKEGGPLCL